MFCFVACSRIPEMLERSLMTSSLALPLLATFGTDSSKARSSTRVANPRSGLFGVRVELENQRIYIMASGMCECFLGIVGHCLPTDELLPVHPHSW